MKNLEENPKIISEKTLQTICATILFNFVLIQIPLGWFLFFYFYTTRFWWLNILYILWYFYNRQRPITGGYSTDLLQFPTLMKHARNYFPAKLIIPEHVILNDKKNYLFCYFPHGILPQGAYYNLINNQSKFQKKFPNFTIRQAVTDFFFMSPYMREIILQKGFVSCSAKSLNYLLSKSEGGNIVALNPGGAYEACFSRQEEYCFFLRKRKGFIKIALQNGVALVPVLTFGENDTFKLIENKNFKIIQMFCRNILRFVPVLFHGRCVKENWIGLIPFRRPLTTVCKPIPVNKIKNPTNEQIDKLHKKFINELINLFETYKHTFLKNPNKQFVKIE